MVLAGVVTGAFFSAGVSVLAFVADPYQKLPAIVFWLLGSFATATYKKVLVAGVPVDALRWTCLAAVTVLVRRRWRSAAWRAGWG